MAYDSFLGDWGGLSWAALLLWAGLSWLAWAHSCICSHLLGLLGAGRLLAGCLGFFSTCPLGLQLASPCCDRVPRAAREQVPVCNRCSLLLVSYVLLSHSQQDTARGSVGRTASGSGHCLVHREGVEWNRSSPPKVERLQFLHMGANGGQWSTGIKAIGKRSCPSGPRGVGKEEAIDREEVDGSKN